MNRCLSCWLVALSLCWLGGGNVRAAQKEDEAAIRKAAQSYAAAFNKGDAKALAAHWLPEAVYVDPESGKKSVGRAAIEKHFAAFLKDMKGAKLTVVVESVKFVSPNVAVEQGTASFVAPSKEPSKNPYTAIHIKHEGQWLLDRVSDEDDPAVVSNYDKLKELEWMVGAWVDQDETATIETNCKWSKNQNFLVRTFSVTVEDKIDVSGVQIVGWDPVAKQIRSWVFDSNGGFGEGMWTKKGKSWHIQMRDTLPTGEKASSVNILTVIDKDRVTWESVGRQAGGVLLPNVGPVTVVRKALSE